MAGKSKGKHKTNKGKSKSKNFNKANTPKSSNSSLEDQRGKDKTSKLKESKNKTPGLNEFNENTSEKELHTKLENLYNKTFQRQLSLEYKQEVVQKATSVATYSDVSRKGKHVSRDLTETVNYFQENIINLAQEARPDWTKSDAIRYLLANNLFVLPDSLSFSLLVNSEKQKMNIGNSVPGEYGGNSNICSNTNPNTSSKDRDCSTNRNVPSSDAKLHTNVNSLKQDIHTPGLRDRLKKKVADASCRKMKDSPTNSPAQLYSLANNEPPTMNNVEEAHTTNKLLSSAINQVRELKTQLRGRKEWGEKKILQATQNLGRDVLELASRMEKMDIENIRERQEVEKRKDTNRMWDLGNALLFKSRERALEVAKREKKEQKKVMAFEKGRKQLEEQIAEQEKELELLELKRAKQEAEVNYSFQMCLLFESFACTFFNLIFVFI